jgi:predicted alpha/beta superfamily hydrolase
LLDGLFAMQLLLYRQSCWSCCLALSSSPCDI